MKVKLIVIIAYIVIGIIIGVQGLIKLKKNGVSPTPRGIIAALILFGLFWPIFDLIDTIMVIISRIRNRKIKGE